MTDVLVVGAGVTGIYQLHRRARQGSTPGWSRPATASGAPGTGTATRAPASTPRATPTATSSRRSCSTSGSGQEHFAGQPETERYLNHVVDQFDLRDHMQFGTPRHRRPSCDERRRHAGRVTTADGDADPRPLPGLRHRRAVGAVPARRARARATSAAWRTTPAGGRRSRSTSPASGWRSSAPSSSGVQVIPDDPRRRRVELTVYQRTANWCTPLNNAPITAEEQAAAPGRLRGAAASAEHVAQRVRPPGQRSAPRSTTRRRSGGRSTSSCGPARAS